MLELIPKVVVDAGFVPCVDDPAPFRGSIAQGLRRGAPEEGDIVDFLVPGIRFAKLNVAEVVTAQVESEEMAGADGFLSGLGRLGVVGRRMLVVTIGGVDVEIRKLFETTKRIITTGTHHG